MPTSKLPSLGKVTQNVEIDILRPTDHKGITVKATRETDIAIETKAYDKEKYMIWKHGPGWSFPKKTKYLAIEGEPLTTYLNADLEYVATTVPEFLKLAWGKDGESLYNKMPDELRNPLEDVKWAASVTVSPAAVESDQTERVLTLLTAQEMLKESSIEIANDVAKTSIKEKGWSPILRQLYLIGFGAFLMYFIDHALELF